MSNINTEPIVKTRVIKIRTHVHATESIEKMDSALEYFLPEELGGILPKERELEHLLSQFNTPIKSILNK